MQQSLISLLRLNTLKHLHVMESSYLQSALVGNALPILHQTELAYSLEARTVFPFNEFTDQQQLIGKSGAQRFPAYFSLNLQLEKRFHFLGYYLALRGGFDNITGRCDPYVVNGVIDATHPQPTFTACQGRAFTSRIRLLGRK